jgi:head-tail adaptor
MRAGLLNRRITIRTGGITTRSTDGEPIFGWSTILGPVWADRQPISGREMFTQDVRWSNVSMRYIIRYTTVAISPADRLIDIDDSSAVYDIKAVINMDDRFDGYELLVERTS